MGQKRWVRLPAVPGSRWIGLLLLFLFAGPLAAQSSFRVIVNADNPTSSAPRSFISKAFLKKVDRWDDGTRVAPVDLRPDSAVREAFSSAVHRRDLRGVLGFWQRQIFSGRDIPPLEVAGDVEAIAYVRSHAGGIGYVSEGARLQGVKVLEVTDLSAGLEPARPSRALLTATLGRSGVAAGREPNRTVSKGLGRGVHASRGTGRQDRIGELRGAGSSIVKPAESASPWREPTLGPQSENGRCEAFRLPHPVPRHASPGVPRNQPPGRGRRGADA